MDSRSLTPHEAGYGMRGGITFCCSNYRFGSSGCNCKGKQDLSKRALKEFNMVQNMTAKQQFIQKDCGLEKLLSQMGVFIHPFWQN